MSERPEDIPEDVWLSASAAWEEAADADTEDHARTIFARALLSERTAQQERDAKIADAEHAECEGTGEWSNGYRAACENVSGAIRKGTT